MAFAFRFSMLEMCTLIHIDFFFILKYLQILLLTFSFFCLNDSFQLLCGVSNSIHRSYAIIDLLFKRYTTFVTDIS